jgi:hypothetical protein
LDRSEKRDTIIIPWQTIRVEVGRFAISHCPGGKRSSDNCHIVHGERPYVVGSNVNITDDGVTVPEFGIKVFLGLDGVLKGEISVAEVCDVAYGAIDDKVYSNA